MVFVTIMGNVYSMGMANKRWTSKDMGRIEIVANNQALPVLTGKTV